MLFLEPQVFSDKIFFLARPLSDYEREKLIIWINEKLIKMFDSLQKKKFIYIKYR